ncbi:hypothetical protein [Ammoniphilus sp. YIM 78166]|uniref:hypothetical protein n=1 Tax=Ammoniphilus sp. YIM 78166 TaxID=1644106 RepID=UPI0010703BB7|nr:hypothetical protein [Ammoniphilus sp. YIM 78166]
MDEEARIKKELADVIVRSLMIGLQNGHITKAEYVSYMKEVKDMQNDSPEEIRQLVELSAEERRKKSGYPS